METETTSDMQFEVKDCTLITRMGGVATAINRRELRERVAGCPAECLFHHFCETVVRPSFDDPEFRNDLAVWCARELRDRVLAERLGAINPYHSHGFEELRGQVLDVIDDRLAEKPHLAPIPASEEFRFMSAVTVIFHTGLVLAEPSDLAKWLPEFSYSSIYYHFVEARRRTPARLDDFSTWLKSFDQETENLRNRLSTIDFYHLTLPQLKSALIAAVRECAEEVLSGS